MADEIRRQAAAKEDFIREYVDAAMETPHESRNPGQIHSDAEAEWEATQIDKAYEGGAR